ncbi:hypothetical protein TGP89_277685 [Toxoplasma gondii p89]|uniref:Uncharacterized protein n=1 Tax=Toxoplasma gondii p89 TaxID=943119 RepID=A0A086JJN6_TOXGO|nr:hypothetical protein TGP89_277685 [Toxoplasma gondii p89]
MCTAGSNHCAGVCNRLESRHLCAQRVFRMSTSGSGDVTARTVADAEKRHHACTCTAQNVIYTVLCISMPVPLQWLKELPPLKR